jgi:tetratricopeptide (TPR) repeat protein
LQLHPRDPATELLYLELLVMQGDDATARPLAQRMLAANPNSFDALYLFGILENDAQEYASAIEHLKAAVAMNPNHYNARYNLGLAYSRLQQNEAAREQFEKAALDPTQAEAHFHLAQVLRSLGQADRAQEQLKLFQECQQATVKLALGQTKAGQAAQALKDGHADQAAALYREAVEAQPQNANFEYDLAKALEAIGDPVQERAALEKAITLKPGFAAAENQLGLIEARSGDTAAAEQHFRSSLAAVPRFAEALNNLGTLLGQESRDTEAEVLFRSAASANPRYTQAWVNLAATLASQSRFSEAQDAVENALKTAPQDPDALRLQQMLAKAGGTSSPSPHTSPGQSSSRVPH